MFKPGDLALVAATQQTVTVKAVLRNSKIIPDLIETTAGAFSESGLRQAHPTVLATAAGVDPMDTYREKLFEKDKDRPPINYELRLEVEKVLRAAKLEVDLRGHWKTGSVFSRLAEFKKRLSKSIYLLGVKASDQEMRDLSKALTSKKSLRRWFDLGPSITLPSEGCSYCGERRFRLETNGKKLRLSGEDCPLPKGFEFNEWELNVPSGKIVVANDLRRWFPIPEGEDDIDSINGVLGCRQTSLAYAAIGMAHASVGNTCPNVFKVVDGKFKIANAPPDQYWNGKEYVAYKKPPKFEGTKVASICTDLWWYSLCDAEEFERRTKKFKGSLKEARATVIDVKPGVYRFRHDDEARADDQSSGKETLFSTFEWVRKPDPVKDFLKGWETVEVNAHAYVQSQVKRWPTLFGVRTKDDDYDGDSALAWSDMTEEQRNQSWLQVANQALCTIGSGTDWHEKGFPQAKVDPSVADIEPPSFRSQISWYPFSRPYGGLFEPEVLAPSFAKLAFRVLESVISFGIEVRDNEHSREVQYTRDRMLLAVERYRELAKKYPDLADPDYVWWLKQKGRAEAWVERFDLGPTFTEKHRKHVQSQRWVPEDAYAIEFDARKLKEDGHFASSSGSWANKKEAERYAILAFEDGQSLTGNNFWGSNASKAIPLYSIARVVKVGEVSNRGETIVEIAFDYGTEWMKDSTKRKGVPEQKEKAAIRVLTKVQYAALLPKMKKSLKDEVQPEA